MNCKFCKNFIPDGSDSCPVCGRRPEEEPMGKLLSENQPSTLAPTNSYAYPEQAAPPAKKKAKRHPKGIFAPLLAIAVSAASWFYGIANGFIDQLKTVYNSTFGASATVDPNGSFVVDGSGFGGDDRATILMIAGIVLLVTIIGVIGVITLLKRLYNRIAYRDE